uniref:Uncharacterized protein n=1 Tax=viral metagenome TaxID=1070528 RepID=A0A6C0LKM8_9ZZZZ
MTIFHFLIYVLYYSVDNKVRPKLPRQTREKSRFSSINRLKRSHNVIIEENSSPGPVKKVHIIIN